MKAERLVLAAAIFGGSSYVLADRFDTTTAALVVWKGAGVALLTLWCAMQARGRDGWLIAAVMACGTAGDVLLETHGLVAGATAFLIGHVVATVLYQTNVRPNITNSQNALSAAVVVATPLISWMLTHQLLVMLYALSLGLMAALAWRSRFPRYRVGVGAMLFVASDLLIFARIGPLGASAWAGFAIWPLYFAGQALIATGVVRTLHPALR